MHPSRSSLSFLAAFALLAAPAQAQWSAASLTAPRQEAASAVLGQKAYFAGGRFGATRSHVVDVYDQASGTWSTTTPLTVARAQLAGAAVGPYVLFAGGTTGASTSSDRIDFLDTGTMIWSTFQLTQARFGLSAVTVGSRVLFAGGATGGPMAAIPSAVVDVYDSALGAPSNPLAWSTTSLQGARGAMGATSIGGLAIFAGGIDGVVAVDTVEVYDSAVGAPTNPLAWSTTTLLGPARAYPATTSVGTRAYFAGGVLDTMNNRSDVVDVYDSAFGAPGDPLAWSTTNLSVARDGMTAIGLGDLVLFAGGATFNGSFAVTDVVDVLVTSTGTWGTSHLSNPRGNMAGAALGNQALFAGGGANPFSGLSTVDVFQCVGATAATYSGDGINADTIAPVAIVLGQPWSAPLTIGHPHGTLGPIQLRMRTGTVNGPNVPSPIGGRLTEPLISGPLLFSASGSHDGVTGDVSTLIVVPKLSLVGLSWAAQYTVLGGGHADLSQAVYGTIGCP